ncbi:hypothetical protein [Salimicrobium halophilum]|uniref:Uncharacterized protein n=1 Tax=Salimicrobium halophilum TaxID=86666 RepID=A0A1G8S794_9BACI|nr:hypothetical protein [Salimicrobium halophilum]SDJ25067.1 hypothetical protein SAMN04490247_1289 [Salimicrobium halophilum]
MRGMKWMLGLLAVLLLGGCSAEFSAGNTTDYMEKGVDHIASKDYVQAAIYFERAMQEGESEEAEAYFKQTSDMNNAMKAYESERYEETLAQLNLVLGENGGSETIRSDARTARENTETWLAFGKEIEEALNKAEQHLTAGSISKAKEEAKTAQIATDTYTELSSYVPEVTRTVEGIREAEEKQQQREEERRLAEAEVAERSSSPVASETSEVPVVEEKKIEGWSYDTYVNGRFGFSFEYPTFLKKDAPPTNGDGISMKGSGFHLKAFGGHAIEERSIEEFYMEELAQHQNVAYKKQANGWYVVSYEEGTDIVYKKFLMNGGTFNTFELTYDAARQEEFAPIVERISDTFSTG